MSIIKIIEISEIKCSIACVHTMYEKGIIDDPIKSLTSSMPVSRSSVVVNEVARSGVFCKLPKETPV